ncbi:MAG: glycoside hydrolase family 5 protein, partial [Pseudomonadota bacterium]
YPVRMVRSVQPRRPVSRIALLCSVTVSLLAATVLAVELTAMGSGSTYPEQASAQDYPSPSAASDFEAQPIRRCINVAAALEAPPDENWGYTIRVEDFSRIRQAGFDTIRLPIKWSAYTGPGPDYRIDPVFLRRVDHYVSEAMNRGLQVMLNVHHFDAFNSRPDAEEARLLAIWAQLSRHFKGRDNALIFELLNEPHFEEVAQRDGTVRDEDYSRSTGIARMNRINAALMALIRRDHPDRWTVLSSSQWGSHYPMIEGVDGVRFTPDYDPRVMTTFHYYEPLEFTHQALEFAGHPPFPRDWGTERDRRDIQTAFREVARYRDGEGLNMPILLGEFGVSTESPTDQRLAYTDHVRRLSEQHGMGWCAFDFASPGFGMFDVTTNRWDAAMLGALMNR